MKVVLSVVVCYLLGGVWADGEALECLGMTPEQLTQLKAHVVTEDVHDKLVGSYDEVWGPKECVDGDPTTCVNYTVTKVDDTHLTLELHGKGAWFGGEMNQKYTKEKVENGVYLLKNAEGTAVAKQYHLSDKPHVRASFACFLHAFPEGSRETSVPHFSVVGVHSDDMKTPLEANVQAELDEVVKKVQDHQDLLKEVVHYKNTC